jgi:hypothetical protein
VDEIGEPLIILNTNFTATFTHLQNTESTIIMERIHTLIDKLSQQKAQAAPPAHLLFTVQLLHQELLQLQGKNGSFPAKKISITLPVNLNLSEEALRVPYTETTKVKEVFVLDQLPEEVIDEEVSVTAFSTPPPREYSLQKPATEEVYRSAAPPVSAAEPSLAFAQSTYFNTTFDTGNEAPTLPAPERRELHHVIAAEKKESLNDRLKENKSEVAHALKDAPIKDLRKAIAINDRFVFVRELFRGDEASYERSIKTINSFNIYSEAEYWIARELKHKLAWEDRNETVTHFYSLVRRRFS